VLIIGTHETVAGSFRTVQGREVQENRRLLDNNLFDLLSQFQSHTLGYVLSPSQNLNQLNHILSFSTSRTFITLRHA
jgi:hypothetical protein